MVTRLVTGKSTRGAIIYNEEKVKQGNATLIQAHQFFKTKEELSLQDKINLFKKYTETNPKAKVNCFHISLNFDSKDNLSPSNLQQITGKFMRHIGFGDQPYLVYQHDDSGHPHIHIVTTNIQIDSKRISDSRIVNRMRRIAEAIEREYQLTYTGRNVLGQYQYPAYDNNIKPIIYPDKCLRNTISNIVTETLNNYQFKSFEDYNKLLNLFNLKGVRLTAKKGIGKQGEAYGLMFQALKQGKEVGVPIYASELLYVERFSVQKLDQKVAQHNNPDFSKHLEHDIEKFLQENITYRPEQLHQYLQEQGYKSLSETKVLDYDTVYLDTRHKTVIALSDIKDEELKHQLLIRKKDYNLSKKDYREISSAIGDFYSQTKKKSNQLESRLIRGLDHGSFDPLKNILSSKYNEKQIDHCLEKFLDSRKEKLEETQQKELKDFLFINEKLYDYLSHMCQHSKRNIMQQMGIEVSEKGSEVHFQHRLYSELEAKITKPYPKGEQREYNTPLTHEDLKLLGHYAFGKKQEKLLEQVITENIQKATLPQAYRLLKYTDQTDFQHKYGHSYLSQLQVQESSSMEDMLMQLARKGVLIQPDKEKGTYTIRIHGFHTSTFQQAPEKISKMLHQENYGHKHYYRIQYQLNSRYKMNKTVHHEGFPASVLSQNHLEPRENHQQSVQQSQISSEQQRRNSLGMKQGNEDDMTEQYQNKRKGFRL